MLPSRSIMRSSSEVFVTEIMENPADGSAKTVPLVGFTFRAKAPAEFVTN